MKEQLKSYKMVNNTFELILFNIKLWLIQIKNNNF